MILSEKQKELTIFIENGMIHNFTSFISIAFLEYEPLKKDSNKLLNKEVLINQKHYKIFSEYSYFGLDDISVTSHLQDDITAFISLLKTLEEHKLIFTLNLPSRYFPAILFFNESKNFYEYKHSYRINDFIFEFKDIEIFSTPNLKKFIANHFKTDDELYKYLDIEHRKKSQNLTIYVAIFSIFISALLSYFLYNNQREVHINNTDPTQIEIKSIDTNILKLLNKPDSINSIK